MTVSNQQTEFPHVGNGVTVTFAYACQVQKAADLRVSINGANVTNGFTKNGIGSLSGGSVTFLVPPASGAAILLERIVVLERTTDYQQNGDFLARVVNPDFDRLWMALQQFFSSLSRALRFPKSDINPVTELPRAADRANKLLSFDTSGNPIVVAPASGSAVDLAIALSSNQGVSLVNSAAWYADTIIGFDASKTPDKAIIVFSGRLSADDPGGGVFEYRKSSVQTVDDCLVFAPVSGGGRLFRMGWTVFGFNGSVRPEWAGALGDGTTNDHDALQKSSDVVQAMPCGGTVELSSGRRYATNGTWSIPKKPDKSTIINGNGAVLLNLPSFDGPIMYCGLAVDTGGFPVELRSIVFRASTDSTNALVMEWSSSSSIQDCKFIGGANGLYLRNTYALVLTRSKFIGCKVSGIQSETYAHNMNIISCQFSSCAVDIYFREPALNLSIFGSDFEAGGSFMQLDKGGSAISIVGGYIEYKTSQPYVFGMMVTGFSMVGVFFSFNATQTWTNISGGRISENIFWDQQQVAGLTFTDVDVSANDFVGTSNRFYSPMKKVSFINGFDNFGFDYAEASYRTDSGGQLHFTGVISGPSDTQAFVMPVGARPFKREVFIIYGESSMTPGKVTFDVDGNVTVIRSGGSANLCGISYTVGS